MLFTILPVLLIVVLIWIFSKKKSNLPLSWVNERLKNTLLFFLLGAVFSFSLDTVLYRVAPNFVFPLGSLNTGFCSDLGGIICIPVLFGIIFGLIGFIIPVGMKSRKIAIVIVLLISLGGFISIKIEEAQIAKDAEIFSRIYTTRAACETATKRQCWYPPTPTAKGYSWIPWFEPGAPPSKYQ